MKAEVGSILEIRRFQKPKNANFTGVIEKGAGDLGEVCCQQTFRDE